MYQTDVREDDHPDLDHAPETWKEEGPAGHRKMTGKREDLQLDEKNPTTPEYRREAGIAERRTQGLGVKGADEEVEA